MEMTIMRVALGLMAVIWGYIAWESYQEGHWWLMVGSAATALVCVTGVII